MTDDIEYKGKHGTLKIPGIFAFLVVMLILILLFTQFTIHFPAYQRSVMGNDSFSPETKILVALSPLAIFGVLFTIFIIILIYAFLEWRKSRK